MAAYTVQSRWQSGFRAGVLMAVFALMCLLDAPGYVGEAQAQYRAGTFIDGQPAFRSRRYRSTVRNLRRQRARKRATRRVRAAKRRAARAAQRRSVRRRVIQRRAAERRLAKLRAQVGAKVRAKRRAQRREAERQRAERQLAEQRTLQQRAAQKQRTAENSRQERAKRRSAVAPVLAVVPKVAAARRNLSTGAAGATNLETVARRVPLPPARYVREVEIARVIVPVPKMTPGTKPLEGTTARARVLPRRVVAMTQPMWQGRKEAKTPAPLQASLQDMRVTRVLPPKPRRRPAKVAPVLQVVVSLKKQRLTLYRNGRAISRSRVSTGKVGHRTPKGIFSIIQKRRHHRSNIYSNAPMPFMQRITWSGIALHMGHVPGYPASHGCIRLPRAFASRLFKTTRMRTHVVIADGAPVPVAFSHPNLPVMSDLDDVRLAVLAAAKPRALRRFRFGVQVAQVRNVLSWRTADTGIANPEPSRAVVSGVQDVGLRYRAPDADREMRELTALLHFDESARLVHRSRAMQTRSDAPLRILVTRRTAQDGLRDVQRQLLALGYDIGGDVDGRLGRGMIGALKAFQRDHDLRVAGLANDETRGLLDQKTGRQQQRGWTVYVRQDGRQIYAGPVAVDAADTPIGTHLYTQVGPSEAGQAGRWTALTLQGKGRLPYWSHKTWRAKVGSIDAMTAHEALSRVRFPQYVRTQIEDRLTPGSSMIIADRGSERETGLATDFVVLAD